MQQIKLYRLLLNNNQIILFLILIIFFRIIKQSNLECLPSYFFQCSDFNKF
jgi:hypothetical protein